MSTFKLTEVEVAQKGDLAIKLRDLRMELDDAFAEADQDIDAVVTKLNGAIREYNEVIDEARTFVAEHAEQWRDDLNDKSEKWQEGYQGQVAESFVCDWEEISLDNVEEVRVPDLENPADTYADDIDGLPSELQE